ncbi:MAG: hypothetical protein WDW38_002746 [Sanguina aurantia]
MIKPCKIATGRPAENRTRLVIRSSRASSLRVVCMASKAKFFVGGNWKCNGSVMAVSTLVTDLNASSSQVPPGIDLVVVPPFVYLDYVVSHLDKEKYQVGAQNVGLNPNGAYTGEVSAEILKDFGIPWVLAGHSERRAMMGETNEIVGRKTAGALELGLNVIACIGETLEQREGGSMFKVLDGQMQAIIDSIPNKESWKRVVVAYEPAQEVHAYLRLWLSGRLGFETASRVRIIYGGSANDKNCRDLAQQEDIDGFLVGGASLKAASFITIANAATVKTGSAV